MKNNIRPKKYFPSRRIVGILIFIIILLYFILLIPESPPSVHIETDNQPFVWNQDSLWFALEKRFIKARQTGCDLLADSISELLLKNHKLLDLIGSNPLKPEDRKFTLLEIGMFDLAPLIAACPHRMSDYVELFSRLRAIVKHQSQNWDMNRAEARETIYRLLYGGRAALEEVMLQAPRETIPACITGSDVSSVTPSANMLGVSIHSGDILVSRGGAPTSAFIARGNDYPGNFSHIALVHVDEKTNRASIIEAHIQQGVAIATLAEYLRDTKLRIMVLRMRADLPQLIADPMLPHKAASLALNDAITRHIPYDFEMNSSDHTKLFCSEVAFAPYRKLGINLWMGISHISSSGIVRWLSLFGVKHFETQEPSDLEYDPQLGVIAEWRDPETLYKDHIDNAVIEMMLRRAESGKKLNYAWYMLPIARILKLYSRLLNVFDVSGPIPEGMTATAALRNKKLTKDHNTIKALVERKATDFKKQKNYTAPYWQLVKFTEDAMLELKY